MFANAPIEIRARAQEDRLQILKTLEAQAAPDAVVSESPDLQNFQNKRPMSEPALHTPDVQDPQNKLPMPEQQPFDTPDAQDPQNKLPVPEPAPHTSAKRQCVSQGCSAGRDAQCRYMEGQTGLTGGARPVRCPPHSPRLRTCQRGQGGERRECDGKVIQSH